jgi:hypothetical protein
MNLDPAPRLNKLVFLAIDVGLLLTAFLVVFFAKNPYAPLPFVTAVLLVVAAAIVGLAPFFVDYSAKYDEYVQAEQLRVAEQAQRLHTAAESLTRAAAQIKAVEEAVHKSAHAAENLPYRMQEKLAEFNEALASKESDDRDALERELDELRAANSDQLKAIADRLTKATAEWSALESAQRKQLTAAQEAGQKLNEQLKATLAAIDARLADLRTAAAGAPGQAPAPAAPATPAAIPAPPDSNESDSSVTAHPFAPTAAPFPVEPAAPTSPIESVRLSEAALAPAEEPKPKKPRAPRKPKPEDTLAAMSAEPVVESAPVVESTTTTVASDESTTPSAVETSASSDGATRLLVTAYIGIGNKLFLRGEGPGLSWDKGVPMQFVSIGKWGWASHDVAGPVRCKLYKNDESAALSGEVTLQPGKHLELTALF